MGTSPVRARPVTTRRGRDTTSSTPAQVINPAAVLVPGVITITPAGPLGAVLTVTSAAGGQPYVTYPPQPLIPR